jgi:hypothetical protein
VARHLYGVANPYVVKMAEPSEDIRYGVYDVRNFWTWRPIFRGWFDNGIDFFENKITTNAIGGRTVPCLNNNSSTQARVFLLGDSQTFGWGLSDSQTWANQLQCELEKNHRGAFKVVNLGFPGSQVDQLHARGVGQVEPAITDRDIVVISFTWNDLITYYVGKKFAHTALKDAGLRAIDSTDISRAYVESLENSLHFSVDRMQGGSLELKLSNPIIYLGEKGWRYPIYKEYGIFIPSFDSVTSFFNSFQHVSTIIRIAGSSARQLYYWLRPQSSLKNKIPSHTFSHNFFVLKSLETRLKQKGARVFVQLLPTRLFFDDHYFSLYSGVWHTFPHQDYMGFIATPFCDSLQLNCLNRYDDLRTASRDQHTFPIDGHYNSAGAAQIAKALSLDLLKSAPLSKQ